MKLKFFDVENKRTTAKKSNGGGNRSITFNKNYKQTKISDMMTRSTYYGIKYNYPLFQIVIVFTIFDKDIIEMHHI